MASLLADEAVPKVGLSLHDDVHQLRQRMPDLQPAGLIELQDVAEHMGLQDKSLQKLFANFFQRSCTAIFQSETKSQDFLFPFCQCSKNFL